MRVKDIINRKRAENSGAADITAAYNKYSTMDDSALVAEFKRIAEQGRNDGTLTDEKLDAMMNSAAQFMTPEQRQKMRSLVGELKK